MNRGFTLIELMIVVAIVAIIAAVALPSYQQQVRDTRRADATAVLLQARQMMERYYSKNYSYQNAPASTIPAKSPIDGGRSYYQVRLSTQTATGFTITATPQGSQQQDSCGALSINHAGQKSVGGSLSVDECW